MSAARRIPDEELHAFIDGELDEARAAAVAAAAAADEILARRITLFRADKDRIGRVYGPLIDRPLPRAWTQRLETWAGTPAPALPRRALLATAAGVGAVAVGLAGYRYLRPADPDAIVEAALAALEATAPAATGAPLAVADRTVADVLGVDARAPDLTRLGYRLTAVTVLAADGRAVALDYRNDAQRRFVIYARRSLGEVRFDMLKRGALRLCVWQDDVVGLVMLGEMSAGEMLRLASLAYAGLTA
jgi:anti-sigma factor RsiW